MAALKEISQIIAEDLRSGRGSRQSLGGSTAVLGPTDLPPTCADWAEKATCKGMTFDATTVGPTGTKAGKVAEGATKPNAITLTTAPVPLEKYAGMATISLERSISADGIASAIYTALAGQSLMAFEADAYAALAAAATDVSADSFLSGIAAAQATLLSQGSRPGVVVVPASMYPDMVAEVAAGPGFASNPASPVGSVLGSLIHVSSATGTEVIVLDPSAVLAVNHEDSPMVNTDPYTLADSNQCRLVLDLIAAFVVSNSAGVAGFSITAAP